MEGTESADTEADSAQNLKIFVDFGAVWCDLQNFQAAVFHTGKCLSVPLKVLIIYGD